LSSLPVVLFIAGSALLAWFSRRSLLKPRTHGFYRFFAWECMLALVLINFPMWTVDPFSPRQIVSWILLATGIPLVIHAVQMLKRIGKPDDARGDDELLGFEKTQSLVTVGVFRYIRHPMYAALLTLAWGAYLKDITPATTTLIAGATLFLLLTALKDEAECLRYFGEPYRAYMRGTKRFVPFLF
jgi:protein-S-isoprenylcysteine O-methyltransferase Ste14